MALSDALAQIHKDHEEGKIDESEMKRRVRDYNAQFDFASRIMYPSSGRKRVLGGFFKPTRKNW